MPNNVAQYISIIEQHLALIKKELNVDMITIDPDRLTHLNSLLSIDCWPEAIAESDIAHETPEMQIDRAKILLDSIIDEDLAGKNFLDFGCGEGYVVKEATERGANAVGYDIADFNWNDSRFTTEITALKPHSFDVIFIYDVLDHVVNIEDPSILMNSVKTLLKSNGTVYIRCHPWVCRHATHLPKIGLNKAFIHLFMKWHELEYLGYKQMPTRMETNPLVAYKWWFREFKIIEERICREGVSDFFHVPSFKNLIIDEQKLEGDRKESFFSDMSINYIDYKLVVK